MAELKEVMNELSIKFTLEQYREEPSSKAKKTLEDYWYITFLKLFLTSPSSSTITACDSYRDDLIFYIKYDTKTKKDEVTVLRKDMKTHPEMISRYVLWDETLYINLLLHEFTYELTCCTLMAAPSTVPLSSKVKNKVTMELYPSHTVRRMDKKEEENILTSYPNLRFYVDSFEDVFDDLTLNEAGEKIAVQLLVINSLLSIKKPIFIGGLDYKVLKSVTEQKEKEKSSMFSLGRRKSSSNSLYATHFKHNYHFIPMIGPDGKGHAEMAVCTTFSPCKGSETHVQDPVSNNDTLTVSKEEDCSQKVFRSTENLLDSSSVEEHEVTISSASLSQHEKESETIDFLKTKHSVKKKKDKKHEGEVAGKMNIQAFLTFIELPWYIIMEDILRSTKEPPL